MNRYIVILSTGTKLCNVAEPERAENICKHYPGSVVYSTASKTVVFRND